MKAPRAMVLVLSCPGVVRSIDETVESIGCLAVACNER